MAKSSVSLWVRDMPFAPSPRRIGARVRPNALQVARRAEIERLNAAGMERVGLLGDQAFLAAGTALYIGEGAKRDGSVKFANSDPAVVRFFCEWLRRFFAINEARLRGRLYLHQGLDLEAATSFWSDVTAIPPEQFTKPYRAVSDAGLRNTKHVFGCFALTYSCSQTHRAIMGLSRALLSSGAIPG